MNGKRAAILLLLFALCLAPGCGPSRPPMAPVRGQVKYQGKPVAGATIAFLCPGASRSANATTDENGNYELTTYEPNDGAIIGTHVVTVVKYNSMSEEDLPPYDPAGGSKAMNEAIAKAMAFQLAEKEKPPLLPPKYAHRSTSDLSKDVVEGENVINIELN